MSAELAAERPYLRLVRPARTDWPEDTLLGDRLAAAAAGDAEAFMAFYDATCHLVWRLELRRRRQPDGAAAATRRRFAEAWRRAAEHAGSGMSPRAWLLSLPLPHHTSTDQETR